MPRTPPAASEKLMPSTACTVPTRLGNQVRRSSSCNIGLAKVSVMLAPYESSVKMSAGDIEGVDRQEEHDGGDENPSPGHGVEKALPVGNHPTEAWVRCRHAESRKLSDPSAMITVASMTPP